MNCCPSTVHDALKRDRAAWARLPLVGVQDGYAGPDLELRNCDAAGCASTLAVEIDEDAKETP